MSTSVLGRPAVINTLSCRHILDSKECLTFSAGCSSSCCLLSVSSASSSTS